MKWNRDLEWFEGPLQLADGSKVELSLSADGPRDRASLLRRSAAALALVDNNLTKLKTATATRLLRLHNKTWNDGKAITRSTFVKRLSLRSIAGYDDDSWELEFDDGGLFRGHTILVSVDERSRVTDATIAG